MEPKYDRLPPLSPNYPWLVAQILEAEDNTGDQVFFTPHDPLSHYRCRIPELRGRRIRACFHGWVILSDHPHGVKWSLWNPLTSKTLRLPPLLLKDKDKDDYIRHSCLSCPPDHPGSILLLTTSQKPTIVFCRLDRKPNRLRWTEMSYAKQLRSIINGEPEPEPDCILGHPICCNGKVYAYATRYKRDGQILQIDILVNEKEVVIRLLPFVSLPIPEHPINYGFFYAYFEGYRGELFAIDVAFLDLARTKPLDVHFYKLDMSSMVWVETKDLNDTVFFVDLAHDFFIGCSTTIGPGYVHVLHKAGKGIYSYHVKDKTISLPSLHCLNLPPRSGALRSSHISVWAMPESRLQGDDGAMCKQDEIVVRSATNEVQNEAYLLNIPLNVLETIMELCVGVEYLNFRATCKCCHLAAPVIQWSNGNARRRLQTYALVSPWLMVFHKDIGVITFTNPMFGDKYFIRPSPEMFFDTRILCSKYGWLLLFIGYRRPVFFNPFTREIRELPEVPAYLPNFSFSAPPMSPDCMVVGFKTSDVGRLAIHFVAREPASWHMVGLDLSGLDSHSFSFPVTCGRDVYTISNSGEVDIFKEIADHLSFTWEAVEVPSKSGPEGEEYFQVKCDEHGVFIVVVGEFGGSVEVWELKEKEKDWEKKHGFGRHMIYISGTTCVCMDAGVPEMENKIYFSRLHCDNGKIVFYSLETRKYHTI